MEACPHVAAKEDTVGSRVPRDRSAAAKEVRK